MTPEEKMEFEGIVKNRNPAMGPTAYDIGYTGDTSIDSVTVACF